MRSAVFMSAVLLAVLASPAAVALDHFKCYPADTESRVEAEVYLRDQFGEGPAAVLATALFCNPATKIYRDEVTEVRNTAAHLQLYKIQVEKPPEPRPVRISNQFQRSQVLEVGGPVLLGAPTAKLEDRPDLRPLSLDHFQCYETGGEPLSVPVALKDQFGFERDLKVVHPRLLCNPVEKRHGDREFRIRNPSDHLVCYGLEGTRLDARASTRNQFGREKLDLRPAELLCVPSAKYESGERPLPGEDVERRREQARAAGSPPQTFQGCGSSTGEFVVTGSESQNPGDDHCFPSDGAGGFAPRSDIPDLTTVDGMDVADMDGDGDNDFLACDGQQGDVYLYTQGPTAVFTSSIVASAVTSGVGGSVFCTNLRIADFNGDGLLDFVVGDNRVTNGTFVYLQGPVGTYTRVLPGLDVSWASPTGAPCNCLFGLAAGDVDGDGSQDVVILGYRGSGAGEVRFYQGDGFGGMGPPVLKFNLSSDFPVSDAPTGLAFFDDEGDGDLDIVAGGASDGSHYIYTNDGAGNFAPPGGLAFSVDNYSGIDGFDVTGDGDDDLMLVDWSNRRLLYAENPGGAGIGGPVQVGVVRGPSIGIGAPEIEPSTPVGQLDHFKCYPTADPKEINAEVELADQFGEWPAKVQRDARFCTPTTKVHNDQVTSIRDHDAHLTFYRIEAETQPVSRRVEVSNQFFRSQDLEVGRPVFLAAPSQKIEPKFHQPPRGLDHFQCYEAEGKGPDASIRLREQFGEEGARVLEARLLCNPVKKRHGEKTFEIRNPEDHLVCYALRGTEISTKAQWRTQFGDHSIPLKPADLLCVPSRKRDPNQDPNITQLCGDYDAINFDGGIVSPGDPGTGLLRQNPGGPFPDGRPRRPCGRWVPIDGFLPSGGVNRFRVAFREHTQPLPAPGIAPGIPTTWHLRDRSILWPFCLTNTANELKTDGSLQQWMDASDYLDAKNGGPISDFCPNSGLRLAVWQSHTAADPNGHYRLWLEWEDSGGVLHQEAFEHHLQLDNKLPDLTSLEVTVEGTGAEVQACGETDGVSLFSVSAEFSDDYYWGYKIRVRGGDPPATAALGWHNYYDGTPEVVNTDRTGTTPTGSNQFLRDVNMTTDFPVGSFTDCCYLLELFVRDAAIRHSFNNRVANENTGAWWDDVSKFITFSASP